MPAHYFTTNPSDLLDDPSIDVIVELTDDAAAAFDVVERALQSGKPVVSASKRMIAENIRQVAAWHQQYEAPFLYEAAVAGSIPILQMLEQFFAPQKVLSIRGILNGSTNYILTLMREKGLSFDEALRAAQDNGFAESDPSLDISGHDATHKLIILAYHAFGAIPSPEEIRVESITNMEDWFYEQARANGQKIKSVAHIYPSKGRLRYKVQPELVDVSDELYPVEFENNAIVVEGSLSGKQLYVGKGAGSLPTAAAVIHDLALWKNGFRYRPKVNLAKEVV